MLRWSQLTAILRESLNFALSGLRNNLLRTLLSTLAIIIGIFTIIALLTFVDSLKINIKNSVSQLGGGVIYVQKWPWLFDNDYPWWKFINRPNPDYNEMRVLQKRMKNYEAIAMISATYGKTISTQKEKESNISVNFISEDYNRVFDFTFLEGRYFSPQEFKTGVARIIIGKKIKESLFPSKDAIGQEIKLLGRKFTVVGVLDKQGNSSININNIDKSVYLPFNQGRYLYGSSMNHLDVAIKVKGKEHFSEDEVEEEVHGVMRSIRKLSPRDEDNFALNRASFINDKLNDIFRSLSIVGWIIAAFSILVGGFGTANIMFVSVRERTFLIGIEKALGSPRIFILGQFLGEAIILCLMGGIAGLTLIIIGILAINASQDDIHLILTAKNVLIGISLSTVIGLVAGFVPAFRASRMDPIAAIRSHF